jgi:hypothetical protein
MAAWLFHVALSSKVLATQITQSLMESLGEHESGSKIHCDNNKGPSCAFENVCVVRNATAEGEYSFSLHLNSKIDLSKMPSVLYLSIVNQLVKSVPISISHRPMSSAQMHVAADLYTGNAVLGSLYGAENFGHHVVETWFTMFKLGEYFAEKFPGHYADHAWFGLGCEDYQYRVESLSLGNTLRDKQFFIDACQHQWDTVGKFVPFGDKQVLENDVPVCFRRLVRFIHVYIFIYIYQ